MAYLFSGLVLSGAVWFLFAGRFLLAFSLLLLSVWLFNWSRKKWRDSNSQDSGSAGDFDNDNQSSDD